MPRKPARHRQPAVTQPLFGEETPADAPLAARMRPRTLDEFVGQSHLVGQEGALTRVVRTGYLPSMVLWGPPGSGKTTLARLLADRFGGTWRPLSAVTSGVADVRQLVADARALRSAGGRTVAFIDELHRFNKAQQDALLPHVEDGTIILIGATTENPYSRDVSRHERPTCPASFHPSVSSSSLRSSGYWSSSGISARAHGGF